MKTKKLLFLSTMFLFLVSLIVVLPKNVMATGEMTDEFKQILNEEGKIVIPNSTKNLSVDYITSYVLNLSNGNYSFNVAASWNEQEKEWLPMVSEDFSEVTITMSEQNSSNNEQHLVEIVYIKEKSEEFQQLLNDEGKLVFKSSKPENIHDFGNFFDMLFDSQNTGMSIGYVSNDLSSMDLTINYGKINQETHTVEIVYNYDPVVKEKLQGFINNFPEDIEFFNVKDLELINYWINNVQNDNSKDETEHLDEYSGELKAAVNNNNIKYYVDNRMGDDGPFFVERVGVAAFTFNDILYYADSNLGTRAEYVIYVPNETGNTKEELIAAAQKRINEYLGKEGIATVSYTGTVYDAWIRGMYDICKWMWVEDEPNMTFEEFVARKDEFLYGNCEDILGVEGVAETDDAFAVTIKVANKEKSFSIIIKKDSSKMITPTYATTDMTTNIKISSESSLIPLDTNIEAEKLTSGTDYEKIIGILDVEENVMFDLKLYSDSLKDYITELEKGKFEVRIPLPESLKEKTTLVAYYVDKNNNIKEYPIEEIEDGYAIFETDHFSIYTIAEIKTIIEDNKEDDNNKENTNTDSTTGNANTDNNKENTNTDNNIVDTNIQSKEEGNINTPKTGDNILLYVGMLLISVIGIVVTSKISKCNKTK